MFRLRITALLAGMALAAILGSSAFADGIPNLSAVPATSTVSNGSSFVADVNISGVTDLYDFQFDFSFNPLVLQATGVSEGAFLLSSHGPGSTFFIPGTIDNTLGLITFNADSLLTTEPGVSGSGTLVIFDFTALAPGKSDLTILDNADLILQDSTGAIIGTTQSNGLVTVQGSSAVPEPSGSMLLGVGLLCLAGLTVKRSGMLTRAN